ncbi:hypothetical protein RJT34_27294 [Clitoria ternatea]|uniref:Uncharacterized protein n=1 Tax=Clitoria ternatea TaxID=43366 RepID=A0AAN9I9M4_CLITE
MDARALRRKDAFRGERPWGDTVCDPWISDRETTYFTGAHDHSDLWLFDDFDQTEAESGALAPTELPVEPAPISIRAGPIDIPIIKSSVNWWNTLHQPGSISRSGTSIHVPMPIPILSNFANFPLSTRILFVLETRLPILSFPESPLRDEIEAREGIAKPSLLPSGVPLFPCIQYI